MKPKQQTVNHAEQYYKHKMARVAMWNKIRSTMAEILVFLILGSVLAALLFGVITFTEKCAKFYSKVSKIEEVEARLNTLAGRVDDTHWVCMAHLSQLSSKVEQKQDKPVWTPWANTVVITNLPATSNLFYIQTNHDGWFTITNSYRRY